MKMQLKRWEKFIDLPSELPDTKIWKFETETLGALKVKFSQKGKYIAIACTKKTSRTLIKIFCVETGEIKAILRGHHDLIHDLEWSPDEDYLASGSADGSVKIWDLKQKESGHSDRLNYTEND